MLARAREAEPGFELTADNAVSLARLCRALNGLPLAIELAAARLTFLSPQELLARFDQGIDALGRGPRDLPPRQRGLRAALDWTHGLLSEDQARLLRRLGAFAGPVSLERIELVVGGGVDLLEALAQLVDLSLVTSRRATGGSSSTPPCRATRATSSPQSARPTSSPSPRRGVRRGRRILGQPLPVRRRCRSQSAVLREEADLGLALTWAAAADEDCFAGLAGGAAMALLFAARLSPWSDMIEQALRLTMAIGGRPRTWLLLAASLAAFQREDVQLAQARLASTVAAAEHVADPRFSCLMHTCSIIFHVLTGATDGVRDEYSLLSRRVAELRDRELAALVQGLEPYVLAYCERRNAEAGAIWAALIADRARTDFAGWSRALLLAGLRAARG